MPGNAPEGAGVVDHMPERGRTLFFEGDPLTPGAQP
jgi:hypothetical protein